MADKNNKPVIFLAFANDRVEDVRYLHHLPDEARRLRDVLDVAVRADLCEVVLRSNSTAGDIFKVLQDPNYRNRIAVFHYGGHANGYQLLLESAAGNTAAADAGGLAAFLAQQQGLQLVFLNGCSTQQQTQGLLDANVPAVISTSSSIDDQVATDFAHQFYQGLAGGATVRTAYNEAEASIKTAKGGNTRALYIRNRDASIIHVEADRWPWNLYLREGSEAADQWNLPAAVGDPLFGMPALPEQDLPESPYRHLNWFTRNDAEVFFGRGHQIRELYDRLTAPRTAPILLFYGQSGVGKSSVLDAGLIPRLERDYEVRYLRRTESGVLDTLRTAFSLDDSDTPVETAWRQTEEQSGKALIVFLDQVEELYTRPSADMTDELEQLLRALKATFNDQNRRPQGKLVLGFRKEWLAELETQLIDCELPRSKVFLEPLDRRGIIEVVRGPAQSERLRERYGLTVEDGLAEIIADDLLEDRESAIAPTLQILLTKLWAKATEENYEHPNFSRTLYQQLKRDGILLRDFLNQQITAFRERYPEQVDSGLLLDIIAMHTTALGTAGQCNLEELQQQYAHLGATLPDLLQQSQDLYLLTVSAGPQKDSSKTTRLAHDTLAPLVRERFDSSERPGQRARRVLENREVDWRAGQQGATLDGSDLRVVERGRTGMRVWTDDERRLVVKSCGRRRNRRIGALGGVAVVIGAIFGGQWLVDAMQVETHRRLVMDESVRLARQADNAREQSPLLAALVASEAVKYPDRSGHALRVPDAERSLRDAMAGLSGIGLWTGRDMEVNAVSVDAAGKWLVAVSDDDTATIWDLENEPAAAQPFYISDVDLAAVGASGRWLVATGSDGDTLRAWNLMAGGPSNDPIVLDGGPLTFDEFTEPEFLEGLGLIDRSGRWVITVETNENLRLWDLEAFDLISESVTLISWCSESVDCPVTIAAERWLLVVDDQRVRVWDLWAAGLNEHEGEPHFLLLGHTAEVTLVAVDDSGRWAVTVSEDSTVRVWDLWAGDPSTKHISVQVESDVLAVDIDDHADKLVVLTENSADYRIQVWNLNAEGKSEKIAELSTEDTEAIDIDSSGQWVTGACYYCDSALVWDLDAPDPAASRRELSNSLGLTRRVNVNAMSVMSTSSPVPIIVAGHEDGTVGIWDVSFPEVYGDKIKIHDEEITAIATGWGRWPLVVADTVGQVRLLYSELNATETSNYFAGSPSMIVFDPTGTWAAASDHSGNVWVWDVARVETPLVLEGPAELPARHRQILAIAVTESGERVITVHRDNVFIWDIDRSNSAMVPRHMGSHHGATFAAMDGSGSLAITASVEGTIQLWNLGGQESFLAARREIEDRSLITALTMDHAGRRAITASSNGRIQLWNLQGADPLADLKSSSFEGGWATSIGVSRSGNRAVTGHRDGVIRVWELSGQPSEVDSLRLVGLEAPVVAVAIGRNEELVIGATDDRRLWFWDIREPSADKGGKVVAENVEGGVSKITVTEDGQSIITGGYDGSIRLWNPSSPESSKLVSHGARMEFATTVEKGGRWVVASSWLEPVALWDLHAADPYASRALLPVPGRNKGDSARDFSCWHDVREVFDHYTAYSDGRWWVVACEVDNTIWAWDLHTEGPQQYWIMLRGHEGRVHSVVVDDSGRWLLSGSQDQTARIWDLSAASPSDDPIVLSGHEGAVYSAVFDAMASRALTGSTDGTARVWNLAAPNPTESATSLIGHTAAVLAVAFSSDDAQALSGSADGTARLWDLQAAAPKSTVLGGHEDVQFVAFGREGRWAATGSDDQSVQLWDLSSSAPAATGMRFSVGAPMTSLALDAENERILTGTQWGGILSWPISSDELMAQAQKLVGRNLTCEEWTRYFGRSLIVKLFLNSRLLSENVSNDSGPTYRSRRKI